MLSCVANDRIIVIQPHISTRTLTVCEHDDVGVWSIHLICTCIHISCLCMSMYVHVYTCAYKQGFICITGPRHLSHLVGSPCCIPVYITTCIRDGNMINTVVFNWHCRLLRTGNICKYGHNHNLESITLNINSRLICTNANTCVLYVTYP